MQTKNMNVLVVCTAPDLGGLELYAEREFRFLNSTPGLHAYFALGANSQLEQRLGHPDESEINQDSLLVLNSHKLFPLWSAWVLARTIDRHKIHTLHMHWGDDLQLCALAKRLSARKPRLIYSRHMRISRAKHDFFHRFLYSQVDLLLAVSSIVLEEARRRLPLDLNQIQLLHPGVAQTETELADCALLPADSPNEQAFNIGMLGRIEPFKGQHLLVKAIIELHEQGIKANAYFIGHAMDEAYLGELQAWVRDAGLEQHVHFLGFMDRPSRLLPCFDVAVLLTRCETFGLSLIEAMRAGVCVIGTNAGGVPDILDHEETGLLIEPDNVDELVTALQFLYRHPERRQQLAAQGKTKADLCFDERTHFEQLTNDYLSNEHQH